MDITSTSLGVVNTSLNGEFQKGIQEGKLLTEELFSEVPSTNAGNVYRWLGHVPGLAEWAENAERKYRNVQTYNFQVNNKKYEGTLTIPITDFEDDNLGTYNNTAKELGAAAKMHPDELVAEMLGHGFVTTGNVTAYDGKAWFADDHSIGESTIDNKLTTVLSSTSYAAAYEKIVGFTVQPDADSAARALNSMFDLRLIIPPALLAEAKAIVENERDSAGATNTWFGSSKIIMLPQLTSYSSTAWYLVNVGNTMKPVLHQVRNKADLVSKTPLNSDTAFNLDQFVWGTRVREAVLPAHVWLAVGSTGATT